MTDSNTEFFRSSDLFLVRYGEVIDAVHTLLFILRHWISRIDSFESIKCLIYSSIAVRVDDKFISLISVFRHQVRTNLHNLLKGIRLLAS